MTELFEALDREGNPTGELLTKQEIFDGGHYRWTVHVWLVNSKGLLLAQLRANNMGKGLWDNMWDVTVGGGVAAGEDPAKAGARELDEELGLKVDAGELKDLGTHEASKFLPEQGIETKEFSRDFLLRREVEFTELKLDPSEVAEVGWVALGDAGRSTEKELWVPHKEGYYSDCINKIKEVL